MSFSEKKTLEKMTRDQFLTPICMLAINVNAERSWPVLYTTGNSKTKNSIASDDVIFWDDEKYPNNLKQY